MKSEVKTLDIDQAAGVLMPFFDPDTNLLYLVGKVGEWVDCVEEKKAVRMRYSTSWVDGWVGGWVDKDARHRSGSWRAHAFL